MRRSTTSVVTDRRRLDRRRLAALLVTELICALLLVGRTEAPSGPTIATPASVTTPTAASTTQSLSDGRTAHFADLGGPRTAPLLSRVAAEMDDAAAAVTAFWGPEWPRDIYIVAAGSDEQFRILAGGGPDIAATTTAERIMFAPGAAVMSDTALRIVLRHELFHYAARAATAADAPVWLTEGVADFVGRPPTPAPPNAAELAVIPTDA
ncbi:MAG TPA: peptidase, partial [Mycobacterium sp.]|nr:peptidase [Mycobacterium sp.]